jgi:hypothetical protein
VAPTESTVIATPDAARRATWGLKGAAPVSRAAELFRLALLRSGESDRGRHVADAQQLLVESRVPQLLEDFRATIAKAHLRHTTSTSPALSNTTTLGDAIAQGGIDGRSSRGRATSAAAAEHRREIDVTIAELANKARADAEAIASACACSGEGWVRGCAMAAQAAAIACGGTFSLNRATTYNAQSFALLESSRTLASLPFAAAAYVLSRTVLLTCDASVFSTTLWIIAACAALARSNAAYRPIETGGAPASLHGESAEELLELVAAVAGKLQLAAQRFDFEVLLDLADVLLTRFVNSAAPIVDPRHHEDPLGLPLDLRFIAFGLLLRCCEAALTALAERAPASLPERLRRMERLKTFVDRVADHLHRCGAATSSRLVALQARLRLHSALSTSAAVITSEESNSSERPAQRKAEVRQVMAMAKDAVQIARDHELAALAGGEDALNTIHAHVFDAILSGRAANTLPATVDGFLRRFDVAFGTADVNLASREKLGHVVANACRDRIASAPAALLQQCQEFLYGSDNAHTGADSLTHARLNNPQAVELEHRRVLGLPGCDSTGKVRPLSERDVAKAYRREAARWHPDTLTGLRDAPAQWKDGGCARAEPDDEDRAFARSRFLQVSAAYEALLPR